MAGKDTLITSDATFENDIATSQGLALLDFWAEWCGPCRMLGPIVDEIATEFQGKVRVYKMNVDESPETPSRFHVRGIPTVMLFKNGQVVEQIVGAHAKGSYISAIQKHLN